MAYMEITPSAVVEVPDHKDLIAAWKRYGGPGTLVARFIVAKRLTPAQFRSLPAALRAKLEYADDSDDFFERLYGLEDPRG